MIKDGRSVLFIHIPKTGGTTIERMFAKAGWEVHFREGKRARPHVFPLLRCSPQHYHADLLVELFDVSRFDVVAGIVREPLARFRSEFSMRHRQLDSTDEDQVATWTERVLTRYAENPYALDNHLRPQTEFLLPGAEVYRLEDSLEAMVADLNARFDLGLPTKVPHKLASHERGIPSSKVPLTPEVRSRVQEFYAADFADLGYPTD
ncbi:sulfotransferase family 2 domain-containing protein [Nocardioides hankookensis]